MAEVSVIESASVFTPLGLRFWDPARDEAIRDTLRVNAWPDGVVSLRRAAFRSASGVYAFERLPRLRLDTAPPGAPGESRGFVVEVADGRRRFLPAALRVTLPLPHPGVFLDGPESSPAVALPGLPLYSAPTRPPSSELAVVRGELYDIGADAPAAHAAVRLVIPGQAEAEARDTWDGLADEKGRFAVFFPQPVFVEALSSPGELSSPPPSDSLPPLEDRRFDLVLKVLYEPDAQVRLAGTALPDYPSLLSQSPAHVWLEPPSEASAAAESFPCELVPGRETVVRTLGLSRLLVEPGES